MCHYQYASIKKGQMNILRNDRVTNILTSGKEKNACALNLARRLAGKIQFLFQLIKCLINSINTSNYVLIKPSFNSLQEYVIPDYFKSKKFM